MEHHAQGLSDPQVALQRALPRVHAAVVCSSVSQPGDVHQEERGRFSSTLIHGVIVEVLGAMGGEAGVQLKKAFLLEGSMGLSVID